MKLVFVDTDTLSAVLIREAPALLTDQGSGEVVTDSKNRRIFRGRVILPGGASSAFGPVGPRQTRLRTLEEPPAIPDGSVARIVGRATLTSWYQPRARGAAATSELTLTCDNIEPLDVRTNRPTTSGLLPVRPFSPDAFPFISVDARLTARGEPDPTPDGALFVATLGLPAGLVDEEGVVRIGLRSAPTDDQLIDFYVNGARIVGLAARFIVPDAADVGRGSKAAMEFTADRLEPFTADTPAVPPAARYQRRPPVPEVTDHAAAEPAASE